MDLMSKLEELNIAIAEQSADFKLLVRLIRSLAEWRPAPLEIPPEMIPGFTMGGRVPIVRNFRDDTFIRLEGQWPDVSISVTVASMVYGRKQVDGLIDQVRNRKTFHYGETDAWLYAALAEYPVAGHAVAIMGSRLPVYEAVCLAFGGFPLTVEYQVRISDDPRLSFASPGEFATGPRRVDAAISVSSFEHDGLGRYGDPLNPDGDLDAMRSLADRLSAGGLLYLTVPFQHDRLLWNVNRWYGPLRLPELIKDYTLLSVFGAPAGLFKSLAPLVIDADAWRRHFDDLGPGSAPEWVLVLRNDPTRA